MEKKLMVESRLNYGRTDFYPVCELSKLFCDIANKKVLTAEMMEKLKKAGFEFVHSKRSAT